MTQQLAAIEYLYRPMYRPAHMSSMPTGVEWDYVEAPACDPMIAVRHGLPLSKQMFGIIATSRRLTPAERVRYQLAIA